MRKIVFFIISLLIISCKASYKTTDSYTRCVVSILFESGVSKLSKENKEEVLRVSKILKQEKSKNFRWEIRGHSDSIESPNNNLKISYQRAQNVKEFLIKKGIDPFLLSVRAIGSKEPVAPYNSNYIIQNRRVEFRLIKN